MELNPKRSTCINCGSKRSTSKLTPFSFNTWLSPTTESKTYHFACKRNDYNYTGKSCLEHLLNKDFNVFMLPYSKKPN